MSSRCIIRLRDGVNLTKKVKDGFTYKSLTPGKEIPVGKDTWTRIRADKDIELVREEIDVDGESILVTENLLEDVRRTYERKLEERDHEIARLKLELETSKGEVRRLKKEIKTITKDSDLIQAHTILNTHWRERVDAVERCTKIRPLIFVLQHLKRKNRKRWTKVDNAVYEKIVERLKSAGYPSEVLDPGVIIDDEEMELPVEYDEE